MKNILFVIAIFAASCASSVPTIKAGNGKEILFCGQANYLFHGSLPMEKVIPMFRAFQYWNISLEQKLFDDDEHHDAHIYVLADKSLAGTARWARTDGNIDDNGCITTAVITVNPDLYNLTDNEIETIFRHEIGHIFGLDEDMSSVQVMLPQLPVHPLPLTQKQVDYIKQNVLKEIDK